MVVGRRVEVRVRERKECRRGVRSRKIGVWEAIVLVVGIWVVRLGVESVDLSFDRVTCTWSLFEHFLISSHPNRFIRSSTCTSSNKILLARWYLLQIRRKALPIIL